MQDAFDKDDKKPKEIARTMMAMMLTIDQENFDGKREVTCYRCHRGSPQPVATPLVMTAEAKPAAGVEVMEWRRAASQGRWGTFRR